MQIIKDIFEELETHAIPKAKAEIRITYDRVTLYVDGLDRIVCESLDAILIGLREHEDLDWMRKKDV